MNDLESHPDPQLPVGRRVVEIVFIVIVFFLVGGNPTPEINEAQYLGKAKHFWDSTWCGPDQFLNSANTHYVFYWTFGWLTQCFSLPATAWIGRLLGWTLIAWAWQRVCGSYCREFGVAIISAGLWLFLVRHFNMAGEWIIGGVEAKTFAYAFVFFGLEALSQGRWRLVWIYFGIASAFHVLVGGWSVVAAFVAYLLCSRARRPSLVSMLPALAIGGMIASAGLLPILLESTEVSPEVFAEGVRLYVFDRVRHHVVIRNFPARFIARFILLASIWGMAAWRRRHDERCSRVNGLVIGSLLITLVGVILDATIGDKTIAAQALRYYWFRLSDVMVPIGCTILFCHLVGGLTDTKWKTCLVAITTAYVVISVSVVFAQQRGRNYPEADKQGRVNSLDQYYAWRDACEWIKSNTAADETVFAPPNHQTFKWNAERAEIVTWKDVPQDARGIIEWRDRLREIRIFLYRGKLRPLDYTNVAIRQLAQKYKFRFAIIEKHRMIPRLLHRVVYENDHYIVYQVE